MKSLSREAHHALHLMAVRSGYLFDKESLLYATAWAANFDDPRCMGLRYQCLICKSILGPNYQAHGLWHLKQSNLLLFL